MKNPLRRSINRLFHLLARFAPGATTIRPWLHRARGVKIHGEIFIGDDVYIENEYPECVEIHDNVQISIRAVLIAHTRGPGKLVIQKDAFIGPNVVLAASGGHVLTIGEGAVISGGCVITKDVAPAAVLANDPPKQFARANIPFTKAGSVDEFIRGLAPVLKSK
jgi:acetyltransferase-like isoleucine patch superfamily enzyme